MSLSLPLIQIKNNRIGNIIKTNIVIFQILHQSAYTNKLVLYARANLIKLCGKPNIQQLLNGIN